MRMKKIFLLVCLFLLVGCASNIKTQELGDIQHSKNMESAVLKEPKQAMVLPESCPNLKDNFGSYVANSFYGWIVELNLTKGNKVSEKISINTEDFNFVYYPILKCNKGQKAGENPNYVYCNIELQYLTESGIIDYTRDAVVIFDIETESYVNTVCD